MNLEYGERVADELRSLILTDRAAWEPQLADELRSRPDLREACGVSEQDLRRLPPGQLRQKIRRAMQRLLNDYPDELLMLEFAAGLHPDAKRRPYTARRLPLAALINYQDRTVRRRIDSAIRLLGQLAALEQRGASGETPNVDYTVSELRAVLDLKQMVVTDERKIHPTRELLTEIVGRFGAPPSDADPQFEVEYGGTLLSSTRQPGGLIEYRVRPPKPLGSHDAHPYKIKHTLPSNQTLGRHFVVQPVGTSYEAVSLAVRFDLDRLPCEVWRIDGVFPRQIDDQHPDRELLSPDSSGLVDAVFHDVHEGLAYGIGWAWPRVSD